MNSKMRSSVMGLILGQFSSPLPMAQKEPVAYLYNGMRLPKLPEWDKSKYPYVMIVHRTSSDHYYVCVYETLNYFSTEILLGRVNNYFGSKDGEPDGKTWLLAPGETAWSLLQDEGWNIGVDTDEDVDICIWANFDLYYSNDTIYVTASEPVPVYE